MDTIFILNSHKQVIDVLSNNGSNPSAPFFDDTYKSELDTGAESYEFTTINNPRTNVTLEVGNYVLFKYNDKYKLFQIMETEDEHSEGKKLLTVYAEMAGMELLNDYCEPFSIEGNFITLLERALQDTNWRVGTYSASLLDNIQSVSYTEPKNVYSIIQENLATFGGVEIEFRVEFRNNQLAALLIDCYESSTRGNRKYRRFEYGKDVKGLTRNRNINDLATAVIGQGNNNVTFKDIEWDKNLGNPCDKPLQQDFVVDIEANDLWNNGGKYIKTVHKVDTDDPQTLLQECWDYLQEIKQPKFDYDVDLALVAEDYQDIGIGDTNYVLDFDYQPAILLEARVGTLELSFADPRDNKCVLTNYKELTSILQQPVDLNTVGNMIQSHFPIEGEDIAMGAIGEGHINVTYYQAIKTDIMSATLAEVGTLIADKADIKDLTAMNAQIENLQANKAEITDLNAINGNITNLTSQVGNIETLLAGNATAGNVQSIHLTSANATIDNAVIKSAMIDSISADKVNTGTLNTNNVIIQSEDGGIKISGTTQQFKDKEGHVRVQIGKDAQGNFTFCLFSQDGVGILLDETGIKAGAVPDGLIVNDMVSDSANISGSKLDISSVITQINNNETTINSSHIKFDDTGQSLLVAFNQLKNQVDTIEEVTVGGDLSSVIEKVNTHTTQIGVMQGQISSLIQNTTITKQDGTVVQLKDAYNQTVSKVDGNTTKIGTLETNYNKVTGDIESVTDRTTALETNLSGVTARVTQNETDISSTKSTVSQHTTDISGIKSSITSLESTTEDHTTRLTTVENNITKEAIVNKISDTFATTDTVSDIESRVQTAENKLTKDGITNIVSDYYATPNYVDTEVSKIDQKADSIASSVEENLNANYATKSLVTQTANDVRFEFKHLSPANLIPNGNGGGMNHDGWYAWNTWWYEWQSPGAPGFVAGDDRNGCVGTSEIQVQPNTKYSLKLHICPEQNTGNTWITVKTWNSDHVNVANDWIADADNSNKTWQTIRTTFTTRSDASRINIEIWSDKRNSTEGGYVTWFSEVMLFEGDSYYPDRYIPNGDTIHSNYTTINTDGVTVYMENGSSSAGRANLNFDGLTIYNGNGNRSAWFGNNSTAFIDRISTNRIDEPSLLRKDTSGCYHVYCAPNATGDGTGRDENNRASSIANALEWFRSTYGTFLWKKDLHVHLASGDYWGADNYIGGWLGTGSIWIDFDQWACLRTPVKIEENTVAIYLVGTVNAWDWNTQNNAYIYLGNVNAIMIRRSTVIIGGLNIQKEGWGGDVNTWNNYEASCICAEKGSHVFVKCCDIVGFWNCVYASDVSVLCIDDCRGHCHTMADVSSGSIFIENLSSPLFVDYPYCHDGGQVIGSFDKRSNSFFTPKPDAPYTPPPTPTENWQWTENTWNASSLWTTPEGSGSGTTARSGCWGQGNWSSYKAHRGHASFDGVNAWCNGGRNFTAYITMRRLDTKHGNYGAVPVPKFVQTDGNSWSCGQAFALGDWKTIQLPWEVVASLIQGGTNELQLWAGRNTSDYSFYDNVSLRITCEKNFI